MVSDIIDSLSNEDDVTKPLLKTLAFARRIGNDDLAKWVSNELNGYSGGEPLPSYRYCKTSVLGVMGHGAHNITPESSLPLTCFDKEFQQMLMKKPFNESIAGLVALTKTTNQYIGKEFAADMCRFLTDQAQKNGCRFSVISCRQLVLISEIIGVITIIKTKLLELLLEVEKDYPTINPLTADDDTKQQINSTVNQYLGNIYNISSSGDGTILNTGNDNQMEIS
ncbi:MAG: hypothetical protein M3O71_23815 [Bacteroidota bacterium]|nr:hypothetical protein [Bacteroidota bacterium]